jgi:hypothetical protein
MRELLRIRIPVAAVVLLTAGAALHARDRQDVRLGGLWQTGSVRSAYDIGYREGVLRGEEDGRDRRDFNYERDGAYRSAELGYDRRFGSRDSFRGEFRRGFAAGYRVGYDRVIAKPRREAGSRRVPPGYQEPAVARGYSQGYDKGLDDGRDHDRYDPIRHGDYREADEGYKRDYGSKDAYRNNYRAGFRQGYEDGYRDGVRRR